MKKLLLAILFAASPAMAGNVPAKQGGMQSNNPTAHSVPVMEGTGAPVFLGPAAANSIIAGTGVTTDPAIVTPSAWLDAVFGPAQGQIIYRGASTWSALAPGTSGTFLETLGAGANPTWAAASSGGETIIQTVTSGVTSTATNPCGNPSLYTSSTPRGFAYSESALSLGTCAPVSVSITPHSTSHCIMVTAQGTAGLITSGATPGNTQGWVAINRGTTWTLGTTNVGNPATFVTNLITTQVWPLNLSGEDNPATTSTITYYLFYSVSTGNTGGTPGAYVAVNGSAGTAAAPTVTSLTATELSGC